MSEFDELLKSAESFLGENANASFARDLYIKTANAVTDTSQLRRLARSLSSRLPDRQFQEQVYILALERAGTKEDYIMFAQLIALFLKDYEFSRKICRNIEVIFLPRKTLMERYNVLLEKIKMLPRIRKITEVKKFLRKYKMNRFIKEVYFKAGKDFVTLDRMEALHAYARYFALCAREEDKGQPIPTRIGKELFRGERDEAVFFEVVEELKEDIENEEVYKTLTESLSPQPTEINLDEAKIGNIKVEHSETVGQLNKLLAEDDVQAVSPATPPTAAESPGIPTDTVSGSRKKDLQSVFQTPPVAPGTVENLGLTTLQKEFLKRLDQAEGRLSDGVVTAFAKEHNIFKSRLVDGINELFSQQFDDILIEEDEFGYGLNGECSEKLQQLLTTETV